MVNNFKEAKINKKLLSLFSTLAILLTPSLASAATTREDLILNGVRSGRIETTCSNISGSTEALFRIRVDQGVINFLGFQFRGNTGEVVSVNTLTFPEDRFLVLDFLERVKIL